MNACCWYLFLTKKSGNKICFFLSFNKDHSSFITYKTMKQRLTLKPKTQKRVKRGR